MCRIALQRTIARFVFFLFDIGVEWLYNKGEINYETQNIDRH